jgi:putative ABC transport system permease protein
MDSPLKISGLPARAKATSWLALRSVWRYRLRATLMMAGIAAGICALTALDAVGEGTRQETVQRFKSMLGTFDTVVIRPGAGRTRGMVSLANVPPSLKFEDVQALASELPQVRQVAFIQNAFDIDVKYRDRTASPAVFGVSPSWFSLRSDELRDGSLISQDDIDSLARVAVLGAEAARALFPDEPAIGNTIRVADIPFVVKGVLEPRGAGPGGASLDDLVDIPVSTAARRLFNRDFLTMAIAQLRDPTQPEEGVEKIRQLLRQRHHIAASALDDFTITSPRAMMNRVMRVRSSLETILIGVAILLSLLGGAMITGLMLTAVTERCREIGTRRALGGASGDILLQFLLEAAWCGVLGGLMGVILGSLLTITATRALGMAAIVSVRALSWEIGVATGLGLLFGLYPALRAARVDPALALRN